MARDGAEVRACCQLQTARLALLRGEAANYRESLRTARNWVGTHFVTDSSAVESMIATIAELEKENISPGLPNISGSLRLLRLSAPADDTMPGNPPSQSAVPADDVMDNEDTADTVDETVTVTENGDTA